MSHSENFVSPSRCCNYLAQFSLMSFLLLLSSIAVTVNAQTDLLNYCGTGPCIEAVRISCEEMIDRYEFQGSCCSLETIPATGGCRLTVSFGNCFYYPWCGECDKKEEESNRCNKIFETDANQRPCPSGDFDPLAIQSAITFEPPSCPPSMAPTIAAPTSGSSTTNTQGFLSLAVSGFYGIAVATVAFIVV